MPRGGNRNRKSSGRGLQNASAATRKRVAKAGAEARWGNNSGDNDESFFSQITGGRRTRRSR